jgi:dTDP-4-amino-4,6-dideoxygalactose transaminase
MMKVEYGYLQEQFAPESELTKAILADIQKESARGFWTLGPWVEKFEEAFAEQLKVRYAVGVNSGTAALELALLASGVRPGERVAVPSNSFVASAGAIASIGAEPYFVDVNDDYLFSWEAIAGNRNPNRKGWDSTMHLLPVHLTGNVVTDLPQQYYDGSVFDAAQAIGAEYKGVSVAALGQAACFSLHPLKNINVWGDGGVVTTNDESFADEIRLLRNHGLQGRDTVVRPGRNERLHAIQAIVGTHVLKELDWLTERRINNATLYDKLLDGATGVELPPRNPDMKQVYHTYVIQVGRRDELQEWLGQQGIETKVHYPVPIHLQPGYAYLGGRWDDLPNVERQSKRILSLPIHQYLKPEQIEYVAERIRHFYDYGIKVSSQTK